MIVSYTSVHNGGDNKDVVSCGDEEVVTGG